MKPGLTERQWTRYVARVYLKQAHATRWPEWRNTLLDWAKRKRNKSNSIKPLQPTLF